MKKAIEFTQRGILLPPEIHNDLTRREFLVAAGLITLAPACGSGEEGGGEAPSGEMRSVEHALGASDIPIEPRRVVVADSYVGLPTALLVGAPVVGAPHIPFEEPFAAFLGEGETDGVEDVGWDQINIEAVAALDPDLIMGSTFYLEEPYDELRQVAPTAATGIVGADTYWKDAIRKVAAFLGREEAINEELAAFEDRVAEFEEAMGGRLDEITVSLVNIRALDDIRIYTADFSSGQVLADAGLRRPENQSPVEDATSINLGIESLSEIDADVILYFVGSSGTDPEEAEAQTERIQSNPLWETLGAVRNGRAYRVNPEWWFNAGSVQAANLILDDLFEHLVEGG